MLACQSANLFTIAEIQLFPFDFIISSPWFVKDLKMCRDKLNPKPIRVSLANLNSSSRRLGK